ATWVQSGINPARSLALTGLAGPTVSPLGTNDIPGARLLDTVIRKKGTEPGEWLYVRCSHDPGKPVLIQLRPTSSSAGFTKRQIAEEHRFYTEANSVSAWFKLTDL